jgi:hypothetical protein
MKTFRFLFSSRRRLAIGQMLTLGTMGIALACGTDTIVALKASDRNRRVSAHVGDRIEITLQTIGSGDYASPPAISSPAVVFLDVAGCGDPVPAGPTQCFHFRAAQSGMAVITFAHTGRNATVQDTIDVR